MLLPFYIMRYEKKKHDMRKNPKLLQVLLNEYDEIRINLEKELTETGKAELYTNLTKLIVKIADHIFKKEEDIRKAIGSEWGLFCCLNSEIRKILIISHAIHWEL